MHDGFSGHSLFRDKVDIYIVFFFFLIKLLVVFQKCHLHIVDEVTRHPLMTYLKKKKNRPVSLVVPSARWWKKRVILIDARFEYLRAAHSATCLPFFFFFHILTVSRPQQPWSCF
jgi:hypothetical protein